MKYKVLIPKKKYLDKAYDILMNGDIDLSKKIYSYYGINEKIFTSDMLGKLLESQGLKDRYKISSGTSDRNTYNGFIGAAIKDLQDGTYYKSYTTPKGNLMARRAIAYMENLKLSQINYTKDNICMTEGSTGAITSVFEYTKCKYPEGEVIIIGPSYYLYNLASKYYGLKSKEIVVANKKYPFRLDFKILNESVTNLWC